MVSTKTAETSVRNSYNAQGFRVAKEVTTDGVTATSCFLYDGEHVIMEADGDGTLTARNVHGGPLLFREVYSEAGAGDVDGNPEKVTYYYLYNAHGDVVTLLSGGEVIATYSYDAFGNLTGQTGEADNSVLYAGYQYDVETGLYYLNARMYDPVAARFLQADTYAGSQSDQLSLNLYTYCMNNPERYIDPSGHIAIELAVIVISAVVAGMAVEAGIQKFIEKKVCIDYNRIVGEGLFSGAISAISFGTGNLLKCTIGPLAAKNALSTGTGLTAKTLAAALIANAAGGAASEAAEEMAHQFFVEGRTFSQIDYRQIGISAALGTVVSAGSTLAGAGIERIKAKRVAKATGGIVGNAEDALPARMQLQYFAGEADGSGRKSKSKWWNEGYVDNLSDTQMLLGVRQSDKGLLTLGSTTRENAMSAGKAWVGDNYHAIKDNAGNVLGYSSDDGMRAFRIQYKPKEGMWRANFQENMMVNNPYPNLGQHNSQLKNVHVDILD